MPSGTRRNPRPAPDPDSPGQSDVSMADAGAGEKLVPIYEGPYVCVAENVHLTTRGELVTSRIGAAVAYDLATNKYTVSYHWTHVHRDVELRSIAMPPIPDGYFDNPKSASVPGFRWNAPYTQPGNAPPGYSSGHHDRKANILSAFAARFGILDVEGRAVTRFETSD